MKHSLGNLIKTIQTGSREEVKIAQNQVEKYWHDVYIPKREEGKQAFSIFLNELDKFDEIADIDHQVYFINTLKWPLWAVGEENFEKWSKFILKYIQHPSGKIRQAIILATNYLIIGIVVSLRSDFNDKISEQDKIRAKKNINRFGNFVYNAEYILSKFDDPGLHKYKYISDLPVGVYKSLQKLISECLLRSDYYVNLYEKWLKENNHKEKILLKEDFEDLNISAKHFNHNNQFGEKKVKNPIKLSQKQRDKLWGETGPYSQANLTFETRILDNKVSRVFLVVEADINPLTFEIIEQNRNKFADDEMMQQLLDHADYRGQEFGYVVSAFAGEYNDKETLIEAQKCLEYTKSTLIKMHEFVMDLLEIEKKC